MTTQGICTDNGTDGHKFHCEQKICFISIQRRDFSIQWYRWSQFLLWMKTMFYCLQIIEWWEPRGRDPPGRSAGWLHWPRNWGPHTTGVSTSNSTKPATYWQKLATAIRTRVCGRNRLRCTRILGKLLLQGIFFLWKQTAIKVNRGLLS